MSYFFGFESSMERRLALIPLLVRMKLDTSGVKLSLAQWNQLPEAERRQLFEFPCDCREDAIAYRETLCRMVEGHTGEAAKLLAIPETLPWNDLSELPAQVIRRTEEAHLAPPSLDQWRSLRPAQRFALLKLTRDGHESADFLPALREFSLT